MDQFHFNLEDLQNAPQCTHCKSSKTFCLKLNQIAVDSIRYSLYECIDCGFWFSPAKDGTTISYDGYDQTLSSRNESYIANRYLQKLNNFSFSEYKSIIEIGCAKGHVLELLKQSYPHLLIGGLELNSNMCDISRKKGIDCHTTIERHNTKYDLIMANHVIEHFNHSSDFLTLFETLGTKKHTVILNFPNKDNIWTKRGYFPDLHVPFHRFYYSLQEVCQLLQNNGYYIDLANTSERGRYFENMKQSRYNHFRDDLDSFKKIALQFDDIDNRYNKNYINQIESKISDLNLGSEAMIIASKK